MAAWPDASMALLSYYGAGEAERAGVGFRHGLDPDFGPGFDSEDDGEQPG